MIGKAWLVLGVIAAGSAAVFLWQIDFSETKGRLTSGLRPTEVGFRDGSATAQLTVAATIFPLADIVQNVAGERVRVLTVVKPGVSPHSASLTPQKVLELAEAQVLFMIGHGLDNAMVGSLTKILELPTVVVDRGVDLRTLVADRNRDQAQTSSVPPGATDPHYWLAVPNAQQIAATVATELIRLDPGQAAEYEANLARYQAQLDTLEIELQQAVEQVASRAIFTLHDAWSYFAAQYGLELIAVFEPKEGHIPSLADIKRLQQVAASQDLVVFYTEPQKESSAAVRIVQQEFGLAVETLDPIGGTIEAPDYLSLMRRNVAAVVRGGR